MVFNSFLESVVKIKHLELFGEQSHAKMSPPYRLDLAKKMKEKAKSARRAGVMALFYPNLTGETYLVLILRNFSLPKRAATSRRPKIVWLDFAEYGFSN